MPVILIAIKDTLKNAGIAHILENHGFGVESIECSELDWTHHNYPQAELVVTDSPVLLYPHKTGDNGSSKRLPILFISQNEALESDRATDGISTFHYGANFDANSFTATVSALTSTLETPSKSSPEVHRPEFAYSCFGPHLVLDGYNCCAEALTSLKTVYKALDEIPDEIGMTKIIQPYVFEYHGKVPEDWGVTGFVIIAESHISIHTFPAKNYISIDIFSCLDFDVEKAKESLIKRFDIRKFECQVFNRGLEFPRNVDYVKNLVTEERMELYQGKNGGNKLSA